MRAAALTYPRSLFFVQSQARSFLELSVNAFDLFVSPSVLSINTRGVTLIGAATGVKIFDHLKILMVLTGSPRRIFCLLPFDH